MHALHQVAEQRVRALENNGWFANNAKCSNPVNLQLLHAEPLAASPDIIECATVLFAATAIRYDEICGVAQKLKKGSVLISATTPLMLPCFGMIARITGEMNWGETVFYLQRKL